MTKADPVFMSACFRCIRTLALFQQQTIALTEPQWPLCGTRRREKGVKLNRERVKLKMTEIPNHGWSGSIQKRRNTDQRLLWAIPWIRGHLLTVTFPMRFAPSTPLPPPSSASIFPPSLSSNSFPMGKADDQYLSHLERAKYMRKRYVLVSGIAKKS